MSLMNHLIWPRIEEYIRIEVYDRDGGHERPRIRIELRDLPLKLSMECQLVEMRCVHCLRMMKPLRRRRGGGHDGLYYACTCPLEVRMGCARGSAAAKEYERFRDIRPVSHQQEMF